MNCMMDLVFVTAIQELACNCVLLNFIVYRIGENDPGTELLCFFKFHGTIGNNDDYIAYGYFFRGGTVKANYTTSTRAFYHISDQSFAVIFVENVHLLIFNEIS